MSFHYLNNMPLENAKADYMSLLLENGFEAKCEKIPVHESCGRITYNAVYAHICAPHYPACAMDGIAVSAKSTFGASETTPIRLTADKFTVVDTGDPLPAECDAVVMIEDVVWDNGDAVIHDAVSPWQHVRQIGEDICAGEMILPGNVEISPAAIGAMIAGGILEVNVYTRPVVGIIPTGDEIVAPTANPAPGDILEFNSAIFASMLTKWGAVAKVYPIVKDIREKILETTQKAANECDIVILNAGSSAGREDFSASVIAEIGEVFCHGIAIKPGKPTILGHRSGKPIIGVPGYPVSGIIVIEQFLKPLVALAAGRNEQSGTQIKATLARSLVSGLKYQEFVRVRLGKVGDRYIASPLARGSGVVSSFMKADGILVVPQGTEGYEAGEEVTINLLRPEEELSGTLVIIGSHDPLLDELCDMMHANDRTVFVSSSHVGSMGGIMAIRRGECHAGGCHLLNEADGTYNTAFIEKYFPNGGVRQLECVGRTQGLMVAPGNPLGISGISDIARSGVRYVNRQKGSGTRILTDYLCKKEGINTSTVYGYDREEFTHTSVAAQIASGTADAGMGIYSAAQLYGLDFIPICIEQYDLLIPDSAWDTPMVKQLVTALKSEEFRNRLEALGGYTLENPGEVRRAY